jgi:hypothetical protein
MDCMTKGVKLSHALAKEAADLVLEHGSVSAAARSLNMDRGSFQVRLRAAESYGLYKLNTANPSRWRPGEEIVAARKAEFQRVKASGPNLSGNVIHRPDDGPFMIVPLGDPHLDSPGTDLTLWEKWTTKFLDRQKHRTGFLMGDVLDNWVKPLAHLYSVSETPAPEGWILLQHYLDQIGDDLDCSVGGNHDNWSGHSDVLAMLMEQHGVLHRADSLRAIYRCPNGREITVNARHSWPGRSMWNAVHGIKRAARMGIRDHILLGGHTHVSGEGKEIDPMSGKISHCFQIAAFKTADDYADALGFLDGHMSPALALVIDPTRADNDAQLVTAFHDPEAAADYLAMLRRKR